MFDFLKRIFGRIEDFIAPHKDEFVGIVRSVFALVTTAVLTYIAFDKLGWLDSLTGWTWYLILLVTLAVLLFISNMFLVWAVRLTRRAKHDKEAQKQLHDVNEQIWAILQKFYRPRKGPIRDQEDE